MFRRPPTSHIIGIVSLGLVLTPLAAAPAVQADGLAGIQGFSTAQTSGCFDEDDSTAQVGQNVIPVLIANFSTQTQTGSITVPGGIAPQVQVFPAGQISYDANGCQRAPLQQRPAAYSENFTVPPGQTAVFWAFLGGVDYNEIQGGGNNVMGIGGMPNTDVGNSWYDFHLDINADMGFSSMNVYYSNTGGTDEATSGQNNFNVLPCWNQNGYLNPGFGTLTPYSSGNANGPTYGFGDPVCLGWFPNGDMVPFANAGAPGYSITAAQENAGPGQSGYVDFAGTYTGPIDSMSYLVTTDQQGDVSQGNLPFNSDITNINASATFAFIDGDEWGAVNIPYPAESTGQVKLFVNGNTFIGSANFDTTD